MGAVCPSLAIPRPRRQMTNERSERRESLVIQIVQRATGKTIVEIADTTLEDVDLQGQNLFCADLENANLCGANLSHTDLRYAHIGDALLDRARMCEADLTRADLHG